MFGEIQVGGSGGRSPLGKQGGFGEAAGPPNSGPSFQRAGGALKVAFSARSPNVFQGTLAILIFSLFLLRRPGLAILRRDLVAMPLL